MKTWVLPNGKFLFGKNTRINFVETNSTKRTQWAKKSAEFGCPANWVVQGTKANPEFRAPCINDTAVFPDVRMRDLVETGL
jgi:hypothetical protein